MRSPAARALRGAVALLSFAYPIALVAVVLTFRLVGERWWVSEVALYLPRIGFALPLPVLALALLACRMPHLLWTQGVALVVLLFPLMGFTVPAPSATNLDAKTVRILTLNANSMEAGVVPILAAIDGYSPDVVLFQEVSVDPKDATFAALKARFANVSTNGQFVLATRLPVREITDPERLPYYGQLRSPRYMRYVLETAAGPIALYNVHPLSPRNELASVRGKGLHREILSGRLFTGASASTVRANSGLRVLQVEDIASRTRAETLPVVLAGDTNLPGLTHLLGVLDQGLIDGFGSAGWGFGYTFPAYRPWMRIDRVLASPALQFVRVQVGCRGVSDHFCVVADLKAR